MSRIQQVRGIVRAVSPINGFVAIEVDGRGEFSVVELLGGELEPDDVVAGALHSLGGVSLLRERSKATLRGFVQDCYCSRARAGELLRQP